FERRIISNELRKTIFRETKVHLRSKLIKRGSSNELAKYHTVNAECLCLLCCQACAKLAAKVGNLALISEGEFLRGNALVSNSDYGIGVSTNYRGRNAPYTEGYD